MSSKRIYTMNPADTDHLVAQLTQLVQRATKLGVSPITWDVGDVHTIIDPDTREETVQQHVTVHGIAPRYHGWAFVASLEIYGDELLAMCAPGESLPEGFDRTDTTQDCDHCGHKRKRTRTYIVRHDDGRTATVGSTCIKDFLGHALPRGLASYMRALDELDGWACGGGSGEWTAPLDSFLAVVAMIIREIGWTSRARAREQVDGTPATADRALGWYDQHPRKRPDPTSADHERAAQAIAWARTISDDDPSDYLQNVRVISAADYVTRKTAGIAASIIAAHGHAMRKAREQSEQEAANAELAATSKHVGEIGDRLTWHVTLRDVFTIEGQFGATWISKWVTDDGSMLTWFGSVEVDHDVDSTMWLTGTVKRHSTYRGVSETHVNRCKLSDEAPKAKRRARKTPANKAKAS